MLIDNIDDAVIRRRYRQGARNFKEVYRGLVDTWQLYDNSGKHPILIREGRRR